MVRPGWVRGARDNPAVTLTHVVDHIDHICQLAGNSQHAAIGSDLDGGFGREQSPSDLDSIEDLQRLPEILSRRGYSDADVGSIMHGNWLRLLRRAWN
jgi:membrane dipeptidase